MVLAQNHIDQLNKVESPEINPCTHGQLICNDGGKTFNEEKMVSLISFAGKTWQLHVKKMKLEHSLTLTKNKLKMY